MTVPFQKHLIAALFLTVFALPAARSAEPAKAGAMPLRGSSMTSDEP
ncbi:MAG: hypothetical protein H0U56_01580 [Methylibium sp.]|nr:hypothetical protein [Methylibium sp.]